MLEQVVDEVILAQYVSVLILRGGKALSKLYFCLSVSMLLKATATLLILTRSAIIVNQHRTHFSILTERFFQLANVTFLSKNMKPV